MRALLTLLIAVGLHTNICTGGVFALTTDLTTQILYAGQEVAPMSYGSIGILSCKHSVREEEDIGMLDVTDCGGTEECIQQLSSLTPDELTIEDTSHSTPDLAIDQFHVQPATPEESLILARAGPLHEYAPSLAHSLIKRE